MLTYIQAIILGATQGLTELFPVSSLGHSVILPTMFGFNIDQKAEFFVVFLVATHFATALVLLGFYYKDWLKIIRSKLALLIIVASVPAGLLGLIFESKLKALFASPLPVSIFLILNGVLLYVSEMLIAKRENSAGVQTVHSDDEIANLSWKNTVKIGFSQALALLPGFSRTGSTISGGLFVGLSHKNAARFSFLLATPIIMAASVLKLPLIVREYGTYPVGPILVGSLVAALFAYISVVFLSKYFENRTMKPFAYYCVAIGLISIVFFQI